VKRARTGVCSLRRFDPRNTPSARDLNDLVKGIRRTNKLITNLGDTGTDLIFMAELRFDIGWFLEDLVDLGPTPPPATARFQHPRTLPNPRCLLGNNVYGQYNKCNHIKHIGRNYPDPSVNNGGYLLNRPALDYSDFFYGGAPALPYTAMYGDPDDFVEPPEATFPWWFATNDACADGNSGNYIYPADLEEVFGDFGSNTVMDNAVDGTGGNGRYDQHAQEGDFGSVQNQVGALFFGADGALAGGFSPSIGPGHFLSAIPLGSTIHQAYAEVISTDLRRVDWTITQALVNAETGELGEYNEDFVTTYTNVSWILMGRSVNQTTGNSTWEYIGATDATDIVNDKQRIIDFTGVVQAFVNDRDDPASTIAAYAFVPSPFASFAGATDMRGMLAGLCPSLTYELWLDEDNELGYFAGGDKYWLSSGTGAYVTWESFSVGRIWVEFSYPNGEQGRVVTYANKPPMND